VSGATILPHGGTLVNRWATDKERQEWLPEIKNLKRIHLTRREISDLEMIGVGAFSPLEGFMGEADYRATRERMRLRNGLPWTIPVTLAVTPEEERDLHAGDDVVLLEDDDHPLGILHLAEKYDYEKKREAAEIYGTTDEAHPGVKVVYDQGEKYLGGKITLLDRPREIPFREHRLDPLETRALFIERGWKRIVAFQTRNPVHRAHEYIQKAALEITDGLLLHPLVGDTKGDDIPPEVRMECYKVLLDNYYPKDRVLLSVLPAAMRYAGPREAIFHAIMRKNYGCSHFIVGRDHAGVGNYYGTYDAQLIFGEFDAAKLGITPLFFEHTFYCKRCEGMASSKTCPHGVDDRVSLSGTQVREFLSKGIEPPHEFSRPEVARVLIAAERAKV
jgi:sulfate adenylyltransferase